MTTLHGMVPKTQMESRLQPLGALPSKNMKRPRLWAARCIHLVNIERPGWYSVEIPDLRGFLARGAEVLGVGHRGCWGCGSPPSRYRQEVTSWVPVGGQAM